MVSFPEAARERDLQRYYQPWLDAQSLVDSADGRAKGLTYEGYKPKLSRDKALTAFAQLAALRLNVRRAMVSLIDSNLQYILAEATRTLSLLSRGADRPEDEVWLGNTIIARDDAVCYHTFTSHYTAHGEDGDIHTAEALVIPDCRLDPRFADRDYVKGEPGVRFYAGVPITTKAGYRIGVYAVSDDHPRDALSASELRFMEDVAEAIMEHLELAKDKDDRNKGERMVRGLTEFIERSSLQEARKEASNRSTTMERQTENARLDAHAEDDEVTGTAFASRNAPRKRTLERETEASRIYHRASRIIRQSTAADGVIFFDTSAAGITGHIYENWSPAGSSDESANPSTTDFDTADSTAKRRRSTRGSLKVTSSSGSQDTSIERKDFGSDAPPVQESRACPVVGLSLQGGVGRSLTEKDFLFTEASMERYIRRYPHGKFFNFRDDGTSVNSSDNLSSTETEHSDNTAATGTPTRKTRKRKDKFVPTEFLKVLPNVKSLIFLPLWDPASERWVAGGIIWSTATGRLMSPENEFPYLKAFGNSITSEVARSIAQKSDRAKTTFIASISHELRSPLHGILGSVEFLHDTVSSSYQESLVSSIETCGKTLLDTIDHVLDYAKINKLRDGGSKRRQRTESRAKRMPGDNSILGVTTDFNLAELVEEVCETVCAGHTFRRKNKTQRNVFHDQAEHLGANDPEPGGQQDEAQQASKEEAQDRVAVSLDVAPSANWAVRSQPGALRRIVMNLLGNALKYTRAGFISVSLVENKGDTGLVDFTLSVEDSGKGMSQDYQRTKLFAPFSQEDPFSSGTGLGLSIVKQIVESLNGQIEVTSSTDSGTKIKVAMKLPSGHGENSRNTQRLLEASEALKQKTASIVFPNEFRDSGNRKIGDSMHTSCRGLHIEAADDLDFAATPDFLLTEATAFDSIVAERASKLPSVPTLGIMCVCTDATEKAAIEVGTVRQAASLGWPIEIVAQPCGPNKLARVLLDLNSRLTEIRKDKALGQSSSSQLHLVPKTLVHRTMSEPGADHIAPHSIASAISTLESAGMKVANAGPNVLSHPYLQASPVTTPVFNPATPPRVLLVDDNAINLKLLTAFAKRHKLPYGEARNGLLAIEEFKAKASATSPPSKPFDFILMDLSMPVMDGLESTREIRKYETENNIPKTTIVALTGLASAQDQQDALDVGVDMYLVKPVKFKDVERLFGLG